VEMDAGVDAPACTPGMVDLCTRAAPTESLVLADELVIDTDNDAQCIPTAQANGPELCLMYFKEVVIQSEGTLRAYGKRPLALAAKSTMEIAGIVDVSSRRARSAQQGAGGAPTDSCSLGATPGPSNSGAGGGAGGTMASTGGAGGMGASVTAIGGVPGTTLSALTSIRGGCDGQAGATGDEAGGAPGQGGGALYLAAPTIQISGFILAGGGGGGGGGRDGGGGGGGSGGTILLQSDGLTVSGFLLAAGGGGGEAGDNTSTVGSPGQDAATQEIARGGSAGTNGGNGGDGATTGTGGVGIVGTPAPAMPADTNGGGGGGGGTGFIVLIGVAPSTQGATIVPPATVRSP
jgi:hypothetical protein